MKVKTELINYFGNKEEGKLMFIIPTFDIGWDPEHISVSFGWLFWQFIIDFIRDCELR